MRQKMEDAKNSAGIDILTMLMQDLKQETYEEFMEAVSEYERKKEITGE